MFGVGMGMVGAAYLAATVGASPMHAVNPLKGPTEVELLEDDVALLVDLKSGESTEIARSALPRHVREGDVIVDGRVDKKATEAFRKQIEDLQKKVLTPSNGGFDL